MIWRAACNFVAEATVLGLSMKGSHRYSTGQVFASWWASRHRAAHHAAAHLSIRRSRSRRAAGLDIGPLCHRLGRSTLAAPQASDGGHLREFKTENSRLRRMIARWTPSSQPARRTAPLLESAKYL